MILGVADCGAMDAEDDTAGGTADCHQPGLSKKEEER
jgi:hypothetical protein